MSNVNMKYLKDESGNVISPVVSDKSMYNKYNENYDDVNTYTTTKETKIGTWINNKPIYRKCFSVSSLGSNVGITTIKHNISNIDDFVRVYGMAKGIPGGETSPEYFEFNSVYRGLQSYDYDLGLLANRTNIIFSKRSDRCDYSGIIVLEYTKTTD